MLRLAGSVVLGSGVGAGLGYVSGLASTPLSYMDRVVMNPLAGDLSAEDQQAAWDSIASTHTAWGAGLGAVLGAAAGAAVGMEPERPPVPALSPAAVEIEERVRDAAIELHPGADGVWRARR